MTYILIVLTMSFSTYQCYDSSGCDNKIRTESRAAYQIYKGKEAMVKDIKDCNDSKDCEIVGIIGCNFSGCKEYSYNLKTSPEIKDTVDLTEKSAS